MVHILVVRDQLELVAYLRIAMAILSCFSEYIGHSYSYVAEALAIRKALVIGSSKQLSHLMVESDNLGVINMLKSQPEHIPWKIASIINDCHHLCSSFESMIFTHTMRQGNAVAYQLALFGSRNRLATIWDRAPPHVLFLSLYEYSCGISFP
ncbi:uncharacterized protein LOC122082131 [Macadamia integrifolia]|uniref:uncharacterized protein LOC122082131 n=1 Tax=Macadamia integrifolia TaxID=60698 RepID=UPI001C4EA7AE|nr:uncharacterized protein LOC122082131 [Macadamia integrifolia]